MNEPPFLKTRNDLNFPSRLIPNPRQKSPRIPRIPHRRGGDSPHLVGAKLLHRTIKAFQRGQRIGHRLRRDQPALKNARAQPRDFAVFVQHLQPVLHHLRNLQPAGIRPNIDRRIRLHF
jgi:hypothetical protein